VFESPRAYQFPFIAHIGTYPMYAPPAGLPNDGQSRCPGGNLSGGDLMNARDSLAIISRDEVNS
jgi:hypothetical protein